GIRDGHVTGVQTCALPISLGRTLDVNHTRPSSSNIGLCTLALLFQIASSPQYGEGASGFPAARGVFGSRTGTFTWLEMWCTGSRSEERRVGKECRSRGAGG